MLSVLFFCILLFCFTVSRSAESYGHSLRLTIELARCYRWKCQEGWSCTYFESCTVQNVRRILLVHPISMTLNLVWNGTDSLGFSWSTVPAKYDQRMFPIRGMSTCFLLGTIYSKVRYVDLCALVDALLSSLSAFVVDEGCQQNYKALQEVLRLLISYRYC